MKVDGIDFEAVPVRGGKAIRREEGVEPWGQDGPLMPANAAARAITRLRRVGMRLAVYGYLPAPLPGATPAQMARQLQLAHIMRPGTFSTPQTPNHPMAGMSGLAHGTSLCGLDVVTNGYASDFTPAELELCPACAERE